MKKLTPIVVFGFISLTGWGSQLNFDDPGALQAVIRQARPSEKTFSGNLFNKNFDQIPYTEQVKKRLLSWLQSLSLLFTFGFKLRESQDFIV